MNQSRKMAKFTIIFKNSRNLGTKNYKYGENQMSVYLFHYSIFQNGLIHILITNRYILMKKNVKSIVWLNRPKTPKSPEPKTFYVQGWSAYEEYRWFSKVLEMTQHKKHPVYWGNKPDKRLIGLHLLVLGRRIYWFIMSTRKRFPKFKVRKYLVKDSNQILKAIRTLSYLIFNSNISFKLITFFGFYDYFCAAPCCPHCYFSSNNDSPR